MQYKCIQKRQWNWKPLNDIEIPPPYLISTLSPSAACCLMPIFICQAGSDFFFYPEAFKVCMRRFKDADNKRRLYLHHFIVFIVSTEKHHRLQLMNVEVSEGR